MQLRTLKLLFIYVIVPLYYAPNLVRCIEVCTSLFIFIMPRGAGERAQVFNRPPALSGPLAAKNMKILLTSTFLIFFATVHGQTNNLTFDWNNPKYFIAKAYLYGLSEEPAGDIIKNGLLNTTVTDTIGVTLTNEQVRKVISVATGKNSGVFGELAECFIPHHGIVFYDKDKKPLASVTICFYCGRMKFIPKTVTPEKGLGILKEVILELKFPVFNDPMDYIEYGKKLKK